MRKALTLALAILGTTTAAFAQQGTPPAGAKSGQRKEQLLQRMDQRIQALQKNRDCLAQAQDDKAARACRPERRQRGPRGGK
jgi:hypothetical protein